MPDTKQYRYFDLDALRHLREVLDQAFVGSKDISYYTAEVPSDGWQADVKPYHVDVNIDGILSTDVPIVGIVQSGNEETDSAMRDAWANVTRIVTSDGHITVYAGAVPAAPIQIQMKVVR